jgi:tyrosine-specific transport protein
MTQFIKALSVFLGTIIGVGIFGLPYIAMKAGFFPVLFYFLLMSVVAITLHLVLAKIILGTEKLHRLPGYVEEYLGSKWKKISLLFLFFGLTGALLAYLIVGGEFLNAIFAPYFGGNAFLYTILFFCAGAFLVFRGIKSISKIEFFLLLIFLGILIMFFIKALPFINAEHFRTVINWKSLTLPYGIVLFSLWGSSIIPEIKEILGKNKKKLNKVIVSGILISMIVYVFFIFTILGVTGENTSKEAISGFSNTLGNGIVDLGFIFGIIACFTSFITLCLTLKKTLWYDFNIPKNISWFIACFLPLSLFLMGFREFIDVISFTGALALGAEAIIIIFLYKAFLKKKNLGKPNPLIYCLPIFFILGIIFEIWYFFVK